MLSYLLTFGKVQRGNLLFEFDQGIGLKISSSQEGFLVIFSEFFILFSDF